MISNFEKALSKDELPEYFRGIGTYFTRDPDWGTQLHVINWQGLCGFLKTQEDPEKILKSAFEDYVKTIANSVDEANDLLENIGCYYYMRKKVPALSKNGYDLVRDMSESEKLIVSKVMQFLRKEISKAGDSQATELYERRIRNLINDGGPKNLENL
ncbi:hypothetical protein [Pseudomonas syringae]|uniref:hypothetical protein n=1 Tax=Pseudomonas syringae TaxID=317 RepID=UPI0023F636A5|nr:hypothetical protein [Pseudomonas syringae]MDF7796629.1 hypothetical protein [Pseudomonas syringae]